MSDPYDEAPEPTIIRQGVTDAIAWPTMLESPAGWTFHAQIRARPGGALLAEWAPEMVDVRPFVLMLPLHPDITSAWTWSTGVLEIKITSPDGAVQRSPQVPVRLSREVVRA